ncbi:hypothetical protein C0992_002610 [Termitomyces sp. T32_za158]|nr:hypothetical protein C0992_002610 [Termitomyces sp. T32_za158]
MVKMVLLNVTSIDVTYRGDGFSMPFEDFLTKLPAVPVSDGYVIQATNVSNLNEIWDQSEAFAIRDPNSISTSATNGPTTIFTTTTITAAASTSVDSSSISSAITTPSSPMSQSISALSSSSPTDTVIYSPTPSQASDKSIPVGSIVGGTLGGLVLILLLGFALVFSRRRHKKKRLTDHEDFSVDPHLHEASIVTPFPRTSVPPFLTLGSSSGSHRNFPSNPESSDYTKPMAYGLEYAMNGVPRALTPGITSHRSQSSHSQTRFQPPKSSMHEAASIGGTSSNSSQPFTDSLGRPSTPSDPCTGSRPAQHSPHIPVLQLPVTLPQESAPVVPGPSTGASRNAPQQPWRPLLVVGGTSYDVDDELPPPSYSSGILVSSVREK